MVAFVAQLVNYGLSLLFWLIVGRWVLSLLVGDKQNFFTQLFWRGTEPVYRLVRRITPRFIGDAWLPLCTIVLIVLLRLALVPLLLTDGSAR
jgi:uncharacterized protein YggT (Ycf19 family)